MKGLTWLVLACLSGAGTTAAAPAAESTAPRFAIARGRVASEPIAVQGRRFAVSATVRQQAIESASPWAGRFELKGGTVVPPGACALVVFRDGYE